MFGFSPPPGRAPDPEQCIHLLGIAQSLNGAVGVAHGVAGIGDNLDDGQPLRIAVAIKLPGDPIADLEGCK